MSSASLGHGHADVDPGRAKAVKSLALAVGGVFLLVGLLGFAVTGFDNFAGVTNETLLGFELNPLHNLVHLAIGLAGLGLARTLSGARTYGWLLVVGYGATFLYGLFAVGRDDINFLSLNGADNGLHLVSVILGLVIALLPVGGSRSAR